MSALIVCRKGMKFSWQTRIIFYFSIFFFDGEKTQTFQKHEPPTGVYLSATKGGFASIPERILDLQDFSANTGVLLRVCENIKKREPFVVVPPSRLSHLPCTVERTTNRAHADMIYHLMLPRNEETCHGTH